MVPRPEDGQVNIPNGTGGCDEGASTRSIWNLWSIVALCDKIDFSVFDAASGYLISAPLQFKINHILNKLLQFKRRVVQDVIFKSEVS